MTWERQACDTKCAAQMPPMVFDDCEHDAGGAHIDGCRCTMVGAPCPQEGQWQCADREQWMRCQQGTWALETSCRNAFDCEYPTIGFCDVSLGAEGECVCIDQG